MKQFKWFWPWDDEQEERWLTEQAQNGLLLSSVQFPHIYVFKQEPPESAIYQLDYFDPKKEDLRDYMDERNQNNWFFIGSMHNWHYFKRSPNTGASLEDAENTESKKEKFYRMMNFLVGFFPIIVIWFPVFGGDFAKPLYYYLAGLAAAVCACYIWYSVKVYRRAVQLKKKSSIQPHQP